MSEKKPRKYVRIRAGNAQIARWRKRMKQFEIDKDWVTNRVLKAFNGDVEKALAWFNTPCVELQGKRPKDHFNPTKIKRFRRRIASLLRPYENKELT